MCMCVLMLALLQLGVMAAPSVASNSSAGTLQLLRTSAVLNVLLMVVPIALAAVVCASQRHGRSVVEVEA